MPNLPVYKVKPQSGKGKFKVIHRDNLLPIVRLPVLDNMEYVQIRPVAQVQRPKRAITDHSTQMECGTSTEFSDLECDWPQR